MAGLVGLFVVVAGVNILYQRQGAINDARQAALASAGFGARTAAQEIAAGLGAVQAQVAELAADPAVRKALGQPAGCSLQFGGSGPFITGHLDIIASDGTVACSSLVSLKPSGYAGARWLAAALRGSVVTSPVVDTRTGQQAEVVATPLPGGGVVAAFLNLAPVGPQLASTLSGARDLEFVVTAANGTTVVARSIRPAAWVGKPVAGTPFAGAAGQAEHRDLDGTPRLYGQVPVAKVRWQVFAGESTAQAFATANQQSSHQVVVTLIGLVVFLLAALVLYRRIARPIASLSAGVRDATNQLPAGPIAVTGPAEVLALTEDFNHLIAAANRELEARSLQGAVAESSADAILGMTLDGVITSWNAGAEQMTGYSHEEMIGNNVSVLAPPGLAGEPAAILERVRVGERLEQVQVQVPRKDGTILDLSYTISPIRDASGVVVGAATVSINPAVGLPGIEADRGQVEQVLLNLAINARDAMPNGGVLTIKTSLTELDDTYANAYPGTSPGCYVELTVSDTGTGMSADVAAHIFEPFFTTKPQGQGTGLGLSTVYGIVIQAGGSISVDSEEGTGTTFHVYFPAASAAAPAQPDRDVLRVGGNGETILVVDDEPAVLAATSRILRQHGYTILGAATHEEALDLASAHDFRLLLTDSVMPKMSGATLAERITEFKPGLAVLYMSGYSHPEPGPSPGRHDRRASIQKPFTSQALLEAVHTAMNATPGKDC